MWSPSELTPAKAVGSTCLYSSPPHAAFSVLGEEGRGCCSLFGCGWEGWLGGVAGKEGPHCENHRLGPGV